MFAGASAVALFAASVHAPSAGPPPADVRFAIEAASPNRQWTMRLTNAGEVPVRVLADARLISFDLTPRGARRPIHCELPPALRPSDTLQRELVLAPNKVYRETFEPLLYCFGSEGIDALQAGATVVAHLGPPGARGKFWRGPVEVSALEGVEPVIAPLAVLDAPPIALPDERTPPLRATHDTASSGSSLLDTPKLRLSVARAVDAASPEDIEVPIAVENEGSLPVTLRFRPESIGFDVSAPVGDQRCAWAQPPTAPTRELFTTVPPHGSVHLTLLLASYCNDHLFDRAGLLVVRPWLDTRGTSGAALGIRAFEGRVVSSEPAFVRLQRGNLPEPLSRPHAQDP